MPEISGSFLTRFYYNVKPFVPRNLRWALRRKRAVGIRERNLETWPINSAAAAAPSGWAGWPDLKAKDQVALNSSSLNRFVHKQK